MLSEVYDIEVLCNLFTYTGYCRQTNTYHQFVIHKSQNDYELLMSHLFRDKLIMVGYNNENYDYPIIHHMINHYDEYKYLSGFELSQKIYKKSQEIIESQFSAVADWNKHIYQVDLMKIMHFDSTAKSTSLKDIEFYLRLDSIEDMPFSHDYWITTQKEIDNILSYNKHDVFATCCLLDVVQGNTELELYKGQDKIQLRKDIQAEFGIKCINYNDVKIGEEINKMEYLKNNPGLRTQDLKNVAPVIRPFTFGQCIPSYVKFKSQKFIDFYNSIKDIQVNINIVNKEDKQSFTLIHNGTKYTIARGGIHSCETGRKLIPGPNELLRDADVGSQYPNAIRKRRLFPNQLGESWLIGYTNNIQRRIDAKKEGKRTGNPKYTSIADTYKLALNGGGFGKSGEPKNWQYDPFLSLSCTIGNQFEILMLIEEMELNNIHVVSANTDGIVCLFDKSLDEKYYEICHNWEKIVGNETLGQLEYTEYKMLIQTSVNDYIAVKPDGKIKLKGDFCIDVEMHKNPSMRIVPIALRDYFVYGKPIEETIKNHNNIYDFCLRMKTNRAYQAEYHYVDLDRSEYKIDQLSKTLRYYISNKGGTLYKREKATGKLIGTNVGFVATTFNRYVEKPMEDYDVNYQFYIMECNKIINQIETSQLTLF